MGSCLGVHKVACEKERRLCITLVAVRYFCRQSHAGLALSYKTICSPFNHNAIFLIFYVMLDSYAHVYWRNEIKADESA